MKYQPTDRVEHRGSARGSIQRLSSTAHLMHAIDGGIERLSEANGFTNTEFERRGTASSRNIRCSFEL